MNCPNCGFELKEGMRFCGKCGSTLVPPTPQVQRPVMPVAPAAPVQQMPAPQPQTPVNNKPEKKQKQPKEKKSKKKLWAILIPVIALIVAIAILVPTVIIPWWQGRNAEPIKRRTSSLAAGYNSSVALKADGMVYTAGLDDESTKEVKTWTEIVALDSSGYITAGIRKDGTVVFADKDKTEWNSDTWTNIDKVSVGKYSVVGVKKDGTAVTESKNDTKIDVSTWKDIAYAAVSDNYAVGVKNDGGAVVAGDNGGMKAEIEKWTDIVSVSVSENVAVGLKSDGTVVVSVKDGTNYDFNVDDWKDIIAVSAGTSHVVGLKSDGTVVSMGDTSNGKLDVSTWEKIVDISAGNEHTLGLREDGTVAAVGKNDNGQCDVSEWTGVMLPSVEGEETQGNTGNSTTADSSEAEAVLSPKSAVEIYMANKEVWKRTTDDMYVYSYSLLDLDFDGVLELITTEFGGSGRYSYNSYYRINIDDKTVEEILSPGIPESDGGYDYNMYEEYPQLYKNKADGKMFYYCADFVNIMSHENVIFYGKMYYDGKEIYTEYMFSEYISAANTTANSTNTDINTYSYYSNGTHADITEDEYNKKFAEFQSNSTNMNLKWKSIPCEDFDSADTATQTKLLTDAYLAFSYDGFSFDNLKTYDLTETNDAPANAAVTLEPTDADIERLELILTSTFSGDFNYKTSSLVYTIENLIVGAFWGTYSYYFDDYEGRYNWEYIKGNVNYDFPDPLGRYTDEFCVTDSDNIEWICENIYHIKFDENYVSEDSYCQGGYVYRSTGAAGSLEHSNITSYKKLDDDKYEVFFDEVYGEIGDEYYGIIGKHRAVVDLQMIDGERHWTFYSVEKI